MAWLPGMGWQTLRDLTHTVLLGCTVAASWWLLQRQSIDEKEITRYYLTLMA